jgi:DNA-directed RNA polymerase subunit beta
LAGTAVDERLSFAKIREALPIEELDLVAIQRDSFDWLIDEGSGGDLRRDLADRGQPGQDGPELPQPPVRGPEVLRRGVQGEGLHLRRAAVRHRGVPQQGRRHDQVPDGLHGRLPRDDRPGTFIINGTERVVVSQLVRSPGVYFDRSVDKTTGRDVYGCKVIPAAARGSSSRSTSATSSPSASTASASSRSASSTAR